MAKKTANITTSQTGLRESAGKQKKADWSNADGQQLIQAISTAASVGGALRLGYSRDGGAYAIGVYGDGDPYTLYVSPEDDINTMLAKIENAFAAIS